MVSQCMTKTELLVLLHNTFTDYFIITQIFFIHILFFFLFSLSFTFLHKGMFDLFFIPQWQSSTQTNDFMCYLRAN